MRGDVLLWTSDGSPISRLIAIAIRDPFTHASVDEGDGTDVGAHSEDGIQRRAVPNDRGITKVDIRALLAQRGSHGKWAEARIEYGLRFVEGEIGNAYGWCNIADNVLAILHIPYRITRLNRYDSSSLVTRYLTVVGVDLGELDEQSDSVSLNDLGRILGVIK